MLIYRITKKQYLTILNGLGGSYEDGARWNKPGTPVLYFGMSAAVAMLEMANYTSTPRMVPPSYRLGIYEIPDDAPIDRLGLADLPDNWSQFPPPDATQRIGNKWLRDGGKFGLIVPSCAVSVGLGEIMVVNPSHKSMSDLKLVDTRADIFNPRAFPGVD